MKYKAIIFDMDGTIIDTRGVWEKATETLIGKKGAAITEEQRTMITTKTHGLHTRPSCQIIKEVLRLQEDVESLVAQLTQIANTSYENNIKFIQGFTDFHAKLKIYNLKTGLATNAGESTVTITKKKLNLERFFGNHIYHSSHVDKPKPHPDIYLHTAKQLGCQPADCVVIEDSAHGINAAKDAGMFCIGINTSQKPELLHRADFIINSYHEIDLPRLLKIK